MQAFQLLLFVLVYNQVNARVLDFDRENLDLSCEGLKDNSLLGSFFDCAEYLLCQDGRYLRKSCPEGQMFDLDLFFCMPEHIVNCTGRGDDNHDHTIHPVAQIQQNNGRNNCLGRPERTRWGNQDNCGIYHECHNGDQIDMSCRMHELFDEATNTCLPSNRVACGTRRIILHPTVPVPPSNWELNPNGCPRQGFFFRPHPGSCENYIICADGSELIHTCGEGLHFNPTTLQCDTPENARCRTVTPPPHITSPPTPMCRPGQIFFPSLTDCTRYFMCVRNVPILLTCPDGFLWNDRIRQCDRSDNVICNASRPYKKIN